MQGFGGFESWDETYVHTKHNEKDRTVLEYRDEGDGKEPWTWVRTHGKGRVFYTAWGHDQRTWGNPGFQNLVERGIRWAVGRRSGASCRQFRRSAAFPVPKMTRRATDVKPFEYVDVGTKIPFYHAGRAVGHARRADQQDAAAAAGRGVAEALRHARRLSRSSCSPPSRRSAASRSS